MNILVLSCGTRCLLIDYFMDRKNGFDSVVTTDCNPYSPALYRSDKYYLVPGMKDPQYLPTLMDICEVEKINAVLPLQEDELVLIAQNYDLFTGRNILPVISDHNVVALCRDKFGFYQYLYNKKIDTVPTYQINNAKQAGDKFGFPLFMKPRFGAGSKSNYVVSTMTMIEDIVENEHEEFILQPYIHGNEYGVNAYVDFVSGEVVEIFILKKIRMRAGETEKSVSVHKEEIKKIVKKVCSTLKIRGPVDIDLLEKDNRFYILEINPRFGGGYPHTHTCGVNFIKLLSNNVRGKTNSCFSMPYENGIVAFRYMTILTMREGDILNE